MLTTTDIKKFQLIYKEQFGTDISKEEATEQGIKLLTLMMSVYKPMTADEMDMINEHRLNEKDKLGNKLQ
jgi:hypothetical protein